MLSQIARMRWFFSLESEATHHHGSQVSEDRASTRQMGQATLTVGRCSCARAPSFAHITLVLPSLVSIPGKVACGGRTWSGDLASLLWTPFTLYVAAEISWPAADLRKFLDWLRGNSTWKRRWKSACWSIACTLAERTCCSRWKRQHPTCPRRHGEALQRTLAKLARLEQFWACLPFQRSCLACTSPMPGHTIFLKSLPRPFACCFETSSSSTFDAML